MLILLSLWLLSSADESGALPHCVFQVLADCRESCRCTHRAQINVFQKAISDRKIVHIPGKRGQEWFVNAPVYIDSVNCNADLAHISERAPKGAAYSGTSDHAWNQVRLDGEWYCVDVTWDDPIVLGAVSEQAAHRYFNVTSDFMRETKHFWDGESVPEAEGTLYAWRP